jgi:hypothetical protein
MNDKEMLIAAAKAAGIEVVTPTMLEYGKWNPLTDDGDALRLAVQLGIDISESQLVYFDKHSRNPYAATRRAIVRAAAEIGKVMP